MILHILKVISCQLKTPKEGVPKAREDSLGKKKESGKNLPTTTTEKRSLKIRNQKLKLVVINVIIVDQLATLQKHVINPTK
jgi:hypothetical protein